MKTKIRLNQIGYISHMPKTAVYTGASDYFQIIDSRNRIMYSGTINKPVFDFASGENVSIIDFSTINLSGIFHIKVGWKRSHEFVISSNPYKNIKNAFIKGLYYNRCSALLHNYAGEYAHPACHDETAALFENSNRYLDVTGGWHDSGIYGKNVVTACTCLGHLLYSYKMTPNSFNDWVNIPESGNGIPDVLNEAKFELKWLIKMQARDGGVHHKVSSVSGINSKLPHEDKTSQFIFERSHQATACFTAVTALASGIFREFDPDFADILYSAAFNSWIWLMNNPKFIPYENHYSVEILTYGDKPDTDFNDDLFWAVCELYSLSGEQGFHDKLMELFPLVNRIGFENGDVGGFGMMAYMLSNQHKENSIVEGIKAKLSLFAEICCNNSHSSGYKTALLSNDYIFNSNLKVLNNAIGLIFAYHILEKNQYLHTAMDQFDYILGKNPVDTCFVTGFGTTGVSRPHHRPSAFDEIEQPVPGLIVVGPNMNKEDEFAKWNITDDTAPAKCYYDIGTCYSTNETAIYCNSAAVFVSAFLDSIENNHNNIAPITKNVYNFTY